MKGLNIHFLGVGGVTFTGNCTQGNSHEHKAAGTVGFLVTTGPGILEGVNVCFCNGYLFF